MSRFIENVRTEFMGFRNIANQSVFGHYYTMFFETKDITATVAISSFLPGVRASSGIQHIKASIMDYENFDELDNLREVRVSGGTSSDLTKQSHNNIRVEKCHSITFYFGHTDCAGNGLITVFEYNTEEVSFIRKIAEQFITFLIFNKKSGAIEEIHEYDFTEYSKYNEQSEKWIKKETSKLKKGLSKNNSLISFKGKRFDFEKEMKIDPKNLKLMEY